MASIHPLGCWPEEETPRRLLLAGQGDGTAPETITLSTGEGTAWPSGDLFSAELERIAVSHPRELPWEQHLLRLRYGKRSVGIALGLRLEGGVRWWEACRMVVLERSECCLVVEVGGVIAHQTPSPESYRQGYGFDLIHKHNWINGRLFVRFYANGVCEVYAHHINSRFFDDGLALETAVPVIGFQTRVAPRESIWDGSANEVCWGEVRFDFTEVARLATPNQPGRLWRDGEFTVLQPYTGCELFGGSPALGRTGDPYIARAEEALIPRGMARTLRFSLSLSERSPRVVRYMAPAWWYGLCEEFSPSPLLPVINPDDALTQETIALVHQHIRKGGFEDGSLPRAVNVFCEGRHEPGWEGEIPYALFLAAWLRGDGMLYQDALRSAYYFTDVCIDHAAKMARMHGWGPHAFSLPMNRVQGTLAAWLETGDPYLLEAAEAVTANAHFVHRNSWPRLTVGRDACYLRSALLLYRYTGSDLFRKYAWEGCQAVILSQKEEGSFGDQGGGSGIHQWSAYITKPWMGLLALGGVLDYLELFPGEEKLEKAVIRFADWLLRERYSYEGIEGWSYQHGYRDGRLFYNPMDGTSTPLPTRDRWHHDTLARLLAYASFATGNPDYLKAWEASYQGVSCLDLDHAISAHFQFIPWLHTRLLNPSVGADGEIALNPSPVQPSGMENLTILTPKGAIAYQRPVLTLS